jgi:hypothetical protein
MSKQDTDASAMAFLNFARKYYAGAEILFASSSKPELTEVLNSLYFHTVELLFKSYLAAHGRSARAGHKISELYRQAQQCGLKFQHDPLGLNNIVSLLESGNRKMGFRYFSMKSGSTAKVTWTHRIVGELLGIVGPFVESTCAKNVSGKPVKLTIKFSEPIPRIV